MIIIPECEADTALTKFLCKKLGIETKLVQHASGAGAVAIQMQKKLNYWCVGIIDNDKSKQPHYFNRFSKQDGTAFLVLKEHKDNPKQHLIIIQPKAIEDWLLRCASLVELSPSAYNIGEDVASLKTSTKNPSIGKNKDFLSFLKELYTREAPPMIMLRDWLQQLSDNG